jgi:hypothetical protein
MADNIPPPPDGFVLDTPPVASNTPAPAAAIPPPPDGFTLDTPLAGKDRGATGAFTDSLGKAVAVPFKPNWNVDNLANHVNSVLPAWMGGTSVAQSEANEAATAAAHPVASGLGTLGGIGVDAYTGGNLAKGVLGAGSALTNTGLDAATTPGAASALTKVAQAAQTAADSKYGSAAIKALTGATTGAGVGLGAGTAVGQPGYGALLGAGGGAVAGLPGTTAAATALLHGLKNEPLGAVLGGSELYDKAKDLMKKDSADDEDD